VVLGAKVHQYFAIEGGYQTTNRQEKQEYYHGDATVVEPILGFIDPGADASMHISQAELRGWHINLIGKLPLNQTTELYALLGVAWNRFYVSTAPVFSNAPANLVSHWQSDEKSMLRLGAGLDKMLTSNFGVRASFVWEEAGTLEGTTVGTGITNPPVNSSELYTAKSKDSYVLGLGFYYQLCPNQA
jgi:opacity protein-like surface antigen